MVKAKEEWGEKPLFELKELREDLLAKSGPFELSRKEIEQDTYLIDLQKQHRKALERQKRGELSEKHYLPASLESEIFRRKLFLIDRKIKNKALVAEAKKVGMPLREFTQKYVFVKVQEQVSDTLIENYKNSHSVPNVTNPNEWIRQQIVEDNKQRSQDYFLEKFVLKLPIEVNLKAPSFPLDVKTEWVPSEGPKNSSLPVHLFADSISSPNIKATKALLDVASRFENLYVGIHPIINAKEPFRYMGAMIRFCVNDTSPNVYFEFLEKSLGNHKQETESVLLNLADEMGLPRNEIFDCLREQKFKDVLAYHSEFNQYLGIQAGPILYVDGEILTGAFGEKQIEAIFCRKLNLNCSAMW